MGEVVAVNDLLVAALAYAAAGLRVLPIWWPAPAGCACPRGRDCASPGKHPCTVHGLDDATVDEEVIRRWWARWPSANVAVRPPPGVVVVDVDPRSGGAEALLALTRRHGDLPPTWTARTGGGGLHAWLSYAGPVPGRLGPGLDIKGERGYVLCPPSVHVSGGRYEWISEHPVARAPGWMRRLLDPPPPALPTVTRAGDGEHAAAGLVRVVAEAGEGGRNRALHWSACRAFERGGDPALLAALRTAALNVGLPSREVEQTLRSARRTVGGASA
ncbi:bifunctional DNA primase/polymerase [Pseudonocardia sp.]|uniref:bifunctional DNA primase/polymerase n=1 Tax=Pseudonocardia sp. TaxID=60912 RepID=UPI003D09D893